MNNALNPNLNWIFSRNKFKKKAVEVANKTSNIQLQMQKKNAHF